MTCHTSRTETRIITCIEQSGDSEDSRGVEGLGGALADGREEREGH
jgi:hypothetical protein